MRYYHLIRQFRDWPRYFLHKFGGRKQNSILFTLRSGIRVEVPCQLMVEFKEVFFSETYLHHWPHGREVKSVLDIGANVGFFSLFAANRFPGAVIHAYEPVPSNFNHLKKQLLLNPKCQIIPHPKAVGTSSSPLELHINSDRPFTTSASLVVNNRDGDTIVVEQVSLETALESLPDRECDFLKMDCEGAEYDILYNTNPDLLKRIRHIAMECHPLDADKRNAAGLSSFIKSQGFEVFIHDNMVYADRSTDR